MKQFIEVMKALRDPNRVKIVKMLHHGELCVCEIQAALGVSQPTVSKHVKIQRRQVFSILEKTGSGSIIRSPMEAKALMPQGS
jgi:DNA-binding transcriptional ArsR family regulator